MDKIICNLDVLLPICAQRPGHGKHFASSLLNPKDVCQRRNCWMKKHSGMKSSSQAHVNFNQIKIEIKHRCPPTAHGPLQPYQVFYDTQLCNWWRWRGMGWPWCAATPSRISRAPLPGRIIEQNNGENTAKKCFCMYCWQNACCLTRWCNPGSFSLSFCAACSHHGFLTFKLDHC